MVTTTIRKKGVRVHLPGQFTRFAWLPLLLWMVSFTGQIVTAQPPGSKTPSAVRRIPLINITDLYHPYQDVRRQF
jgi:hypothetical protein